MTRVFVTGATGFLGRRVVGRLAAIGATVTAHGKTTAPSPFAPEIEYVRGDLADPHVAAELLSPWRWDTIVHLAGPVTGGNESVATGIDVVATHARLALQVQRHAAGARIVHASSMTVYGLLGSGPIAENHERRPQHLYGLAKMIAEDILLPGAWVLRLPGLFAEDRRGGALYHFCRAARRHEPVRINAATPTAWDVLHVVDAADAIARATSATGPGGAINISHGEPVELDAIARLIASRTGAPVESSSVSHPVFQLDITRARELLGWSPPPLRDRLFALYDAYAEEPA